MNDPCEACVKKFGRVVGEYIAERHRWKERQDDGHLTCHCPPEPPDMSFLKNCPYELDHCPLKGGE